MWAPEPSAGTDEAVERRQSERGEGMGSPEGHPVALAEEQLSAPATP